MVDEEFEGPRRKTYTPPEASEPFTGSLPVMGESVTPELQPAVPAKPTSALSPPARMSLTDAEILEQFQAQNAGSTQQMMDELERQVNLREEEEEAFQSWANLTRATRGADAEGIISRARIVFDGGDPEPEPEVEPEPEEEPEDELETEPEALGLEDDDVDGDVPEELNAEEPVAFDVTAEEETPESHADAVDDVVEEEDPDQWPLAQEPSPQPEDSTLPDEPVEQVRKSDFGVESLPESQRGVSLLGAAGVWLSAVLPALGLLVGSYFVVRGLGVVETFVALAAGGLVAGLLIAVAASVANRNGVSSVRAALATFGSVGHTVPGAFLLLIRFVVAATLVVWGASFVARIVELSGVWRFDAAIVHPVTTALVALLAIVLAVLGGKVLTVALWVGAGVGFVGVGLFVWLSAQTLTVAEDLGVWTAEPLTVIAAGSLVLVTFVLLFVPTASDWLQPGEGTASTGLKWIAGVIAVIPTVLLGTYVAWVSVSSPDWLPQLASDPILIVANNAPLWYPIPAALVMAVPVLVLAAGALRSAGVNSVALGIQITPRIATVLSAVVVVLALAAQVVFAHSIVRYLPDALYTLGVVVVAWAVIFAVDAVGTTASDNQADVPAWRFGPLLGWAVSVVLGWGLLSSNVSWLAWQGYLLPVLETLGLMDLSAAQPGVLVAGIVGAVVAGVARLIRARKTTEVLNA